MVTDTDADGTADAADDQRGPDGAVGADTPAEYEVVVVGGGPGGMTAALYTTRLGHDTAVIDHDGARTGIDIHCDLREFPLDVPGTAGAGVDPAVDAAIPSSGAEAAGSATDD